MSFLLSTSWDDGAVEDLRLAELLEKYDIPATFYIPIENDERDVLSRKQIASLSKNFEIGGHTYTHKDLTKLSRTEAKDEILRGKWEIENITGNDIQSFAYPKGKYDEKVKQLVGLSGFEFARTTQLFEMDFHDPLEIGTTIHAYNHHKLLLCREFLKASRFGRMGDCIRPWEDLARSYLDYCAVHGGMFHLWGHSWEIEEYDQWDTVESLFKYIHRMTKPQYRVANSELFSTLYSKKSEHYSSIDPAEYHQSQIANHSDDLARLQRYVDMYDTKGRRVLDAGCGTGRFAEYVTEADYVGIDASEQLIRFAQKMFADTTHTFKQGDGLNIRNLGSFDLILLWGLLEDRANPYQAIQLLLKSLTKGGTLIFTVHNAGNMMFQLSQRVRALTGALFPSASFSIEIVTEYAELPDKYKQTVTDCGDYLMVEISRK